MADIKLFNIVGEVKELPSSSVTLEKELQNIIETNMTTFFGVRFLASEYSTTNGGRMDRRISGRLICRNEKIDGQDMEADEPPLCLRFIIYRAASSRRTAE